MKTKKVFSILFLMAAIVSLSGCSLNIFKKNNPPDQNQVKDIPPVVNDKIKKFATIDELKKFIKENQAVPAANDLFSAREGMMNKTVAEDSAGSAPANGGGADFSKTNIQIEGVDEADIIKTDGKYIYTFSNQKLNIIEAFPAEGAKIVSTIELDAQPQNLYLDGNALVVFGQKYSPIKPLSNSPVSNPETAVENKMNIGMIREMILPNPQSTFTFLKVYDLSDKQSPKLSRDLAFEGNYSDSRLIDGYLYFVTSKYSYSDDNPLPIIMRNGEVSAADQMPSVFYFDIPYNSFNFTTVTAINIKDSNQKESGQTYLLSSQQNMFVSENNIYITYTKNFDENKVVLETTREMVEPKISVKDQEKIKKIEAADEEVISKEEKLNKINIVLSQYLASLAPADVEKINQEITNKIKEKYKNLADELEKTSIHKISINKEKIEYKNFAEVKGQVLNQFSMDESDGFFRIATTRNRVWSQFVDEKEADSSNNLFILDENLKQVGALEGLAKGERIYSVRFMGKRAYMVTFKQTDPLFVIDLAIPTDPKVLGELKIPGFSNYLHLYDENTLIGIGKETTEDPSGRVLTGGLKISLFDVTKADQPIELDKYVAGDMGSDSVALYDHKAFLFSKEKQLLVLPVSLTEKTNDQSWGKFVFGGAMVFMVDGKKITLKGKIDHSDNGKAGNVESLNGYSYYDNTVKRSLYIDETLYTLSGKYLNMNNLKDLKQINSLEIKSEEQGVQPKYNPEMDGEIVY
ncbi:MAG: hypothetical protein UT48_C0009G0009 [Parcubacteria group bacterium GW2011_GWE2_39_37]|uniref:Copper amine oxidase-like protein n=1 Tax=Candidatus Falkowbacteria bacterium GW2011_GWF2_39_8 TaxID=1618642 RepID=A0A0G0T0E5_9BACT|nr:MAG: hypothetical protein UT48_C0009G0009 [Parcubacteria group bacterium GW2011_GWE2_39_37]KKR31307.1 MAG: hypothetical protein UT64_C0065G0005 [Candidatus Falkowbacteria bacterium GW2011_GWF2_39_8]